MICKRINKHTQEMMHTNHQIVRTCSTTHSPSLQNPECLAHVTTRKILTTVRTHFSQTSTSHVVSQTSQSNIRASNGHYH